MKHTLALMLLLLMQPLSLWAQNEKKYTGSVSDEKGEPLLGVNVKVADAKEATITDIDGHYTLTTDKPNPTLEFSYIGFETQCIPTGGSTTLNVTLKEGTNEMQEVVVTAMGIQRKESSLTYATQRVKASDLTTVEDPSVATQLQGKVAGITVTPNASGAGGGSKIVLRGIKSLYGNSDPLIVVDGIPMQNSIRDAKAIGQENQFGELLECEGSDPLSLINPDDIESINVLKGANAAALYGAKAANGVVMITTKSGREGKIGVSYSSNVTFSTPLVTPHIQKEYGAAALGAGQLTAHAWGPHINSQQQTQRIIEVTPCLNIEQPLQTRLRNYARDEVAEFFRTGVTTNNSASVTGGTEKMQTYLSLANSHATGMMPNNAYNRNSIQLRQNFLLWKRLKIDASFNFAQTKTNNRPGGGKITNPVYHIYTMPQNIDMAYYKDNYITQNGSWLSNPQEHYVENIIQNPDGSKSSYYTLKAGDRAHLSGPMQNWAYMDQDQNNPYWLINMNKRTEREERIFGTFNASLDIWGGLSAQMRMNIDQNRHTLDKREYATTFNEWQMHDYGNYTNTASKRTDLYTDVLLHYNTKVKDFTLSATAGLEGHTTRTEATQTYLPEATYQPRVNDIMLQLPTLVNYFDVSGGGSGVTTYNETTNWDRAALFTAQIGWKDAIFIDGSYRQDWWRPFRIFKKMGIVNSDNFGHYGIGASAIISELTALPKWLTYLKWRGSYSLVGNSIPNIDFFKTTQNLSTGASTGSAYGAFVPTEEQNKSFETGIDIMFFKDRLSLDFTYYNAVMDNLYMERTINGVNQPINSARVRNQGFEATIGYNQKLTRKLTWRTQYNVAYNSNRLERTAYNELGQEIPPKQTIEGMNVIYREGGSMGDMYAHDYRRDDNGQIIIKDNGKIAFNIDGKHEVYVGNMYSKWQMGWNNTFHYGNFQLHFLINGRIGGKVVSYTEAFLDRWGLSQRTADARMAAEAQGLYAPYGDGTQLGMYLPDGSGRVVPIRSYYETISASYCPKEYVYNATNFRLRELSLGYTFRNLFGENKNLGVSFVARNLFFLYNAAPVDPEVSLSTGTGHEGFEFFNQPSARTFGFSLKLNL